MTRPRLLLVPSLTELEWRIKPLLEEWAEVATFDAPGVGDEPPVEEPGLQALVSRGLAEIEARGWDQLVLAGDEFGCVTAIHISNRRPEAVVGLALGHGCVNIVREGSRPTLNWEVMKTFGRMVRVDFRTYVRHLTQVTHGAYDDELADSYLQRVPQHVAEAYTGFARDPGPLTEMIRSLDVPLLLAEHKKCLGWTEEGFEDAVAAFPDAKTTGSELKPSVDPDFAAALRGFAEPLFR